MTKEDAINLKETLDNLIVGLNGYQKEIENWANETDEEDKDMKRSLLRLAEDVYYAGYRALGIKQTVEKGINENEDK